MIDSPNIISGARTVAHMAAHFEELKEVSLKLNKQAAASTRGYFTPSEDEEVRHLLVSYWQSRNALYDLVISLRDGQRNYQYRPRGDLLGSLCRGHTSG